MPRSKTGRPTGALLAFGRQVSAGEAFAELIEERGWRTENWTPTFVESCDREHIRNLCRELSAGAEWDHKRVLRRCPKPPEPSGVGYNAETEEARLTIAPSDGLPSLYFVEWHYIDFVMSCLGNLSEAARVLGVRRSTLQRKRKKTPPSR
jgi:hypothetical protein